MRRCSEHTLRVLRAQKESLLTLIEVFVHDPLYNWRITEEQADRRQLAAAAEAAEAAAADAEKKKNEEDEAKPEGPKLIANVDANRTLLRIKHKLEGIEAGELGDEVFVVCYSQVQIFITYLHALSFLCWLFIFAGDSAPRSVEGQVQHLLVEATDPDNLCRMFCGWQPCL